jgi:hypothetical protein
MGVVRLKYRMLLLDRTTPTLALPLQGGGDATVETVISQPKRPTPFDNDSRVNARL